MENKIKFDEIGYWSELELDIVKEYAQAYTTILSSEKNKYISYSYIDAFSGSGIQFSKTKNEFIPGSPLNALLIKPRFNKYYFIDLDSDKAEGLKKLTKDESNVVILKGDCNNVLLREVFPNIKFKDYQRGLCLLDPYGLHLNWEVIQTAGKMLSIEIFLNFPVADINRNVLWRKPEGVDKADIERMDAFWGDNSWRNIAYAKEKDLFGADYEEKENIKVVVEAFRQRLKEIADFKFVPEPIPMRNSKGAIVYYLFFASQKPVAEKIITDIFKKYRNKGVR